MKDCSHHFNRCEFCSPCYCECHRQEGVYHFMACCRTCSECGEHHRKQHDTKENRANREEGTLP